MKYGLLACVFIVSISGCQSLVSQKTAQLVPTREIKGQGESVTMPANLRTISIKNKSSSYISCAEPWPDIALSETFKMITGITSDSSVSASSPATSPNVTNKIVANNDLQVSTTAMELAGRTQTVLLARELLYRTCEDASNGWLTAADVKSAHMAVIEGVVSLMNADRKKAEASASMAMAVAVSKLDQEILTNTSVAVDEAIADSCTESFESCISKSGISDEDKQVCRTSLKKCMP